MVVDTSLAVKWFLPEDYSVEAMALLRSWQHQGVDRIVPGWFACEVANVLYQRLRSGGVDLLQAQTGVKTILNWTTVHDVEPAVSERSLEIAAVLGRPASYDSHYVAVAERLDCDLWTADERFWNAASSTFPWIRWIGELSLGTSHANPVGQSGPTGTGQAGP